MQEPALHTAQMDDDPWLRIPAADYEAHMSAIGQSAALRQLFSRVYASVRPRRLAILGCTDGADIEDVDFEVTEFAVGVDINPKYLQRASERHRAPEGRLRFVCGDVLDMELQGGPFELIHAALLLEYVDPKRVFRRIREWLAPAGVCSVVTQDPHDTLSAVSQTGYASLELLADRMTLRTAAEVAAAAQCSGLHQVEQQTMQLPGGKTFTQSVLRLKGSE